MTPLVNGQRYDFACTQDRQYDDLPPFVEFAPRIISAGFMRLSQFENGLISGRFIPRLCVVLTDMEGVLLDLIDHYLAGSLSFNDFRRAYYYTYLREPAVDEIPRDRGEFFSRAQERLDWTDSYPDAGSRSDGWIDVGEYRDWLSEMRADWARAFG